MKHLINRKNILGIVLFLGSVLMNVVMTNVVMISEARALGRTCGDLFQDNLLSWHEVRSAQLEHKVDRASLAAASALTESFASRVADSAAFTRMVQAHIVQTFEANLKLMYEQRRDLYDFLVDPKSPLSPDHLGELLGSTSRIYSAKAEGGELFHVASQDKNAFFEVANRLKQNRGALH